jgi:hypothetical protein
VDFFAGQPTVRVAIRLRNPQRARHRGGFWDLGDPGSVYITEASWTLAFASGHHPTLVRCSPEIGAPHQALDLPFELYQDSSGGENWRSTAHVNRHGQVVHRFCGYRLRSGSIENAGLRATPVVSVESPTSCVSLAVPQFWQNFPKAIEAGEAQLQLKHFPSQYGDLHELQGGEQKTHVCVLAFGVDPVGETPLDWCRTPARVTVRPEWCFMTGAVPWLAADERRHEALVASAVEGPDRFERKREVVDEYGWRHFGDVYGDHEAVRHTGQMPLVSHYNNQYDPIAGFLYQYLRTADLRWYTMATELAAHVVDIDVYHTERDKWAYNHGLFWHTYHYGDAGTSSHRTYPLAARGVVHGGGPSPDHNYTTGLMLHHFLTGDPASRETVLELAQFVIDADDGTRTPLRWLSRANTGFATASGSYAYHGPGRGPANSLNALLDGYHLSGERRFLDKGEALIRRVVHPTDDVSQHRLDDPENKWFYLMFFQSLGKYLWYKAEWSELDDMYAYGRAALLIYARWMAEHEYPYLDKPERLQFPTETWAAHEIRKSDVFHHAALHASGQERARFLERAQYFFRVCVETLERMPTRTLARPVVVLLSSGMLEPWRAGHPDAALPPADSRTTGFGDPAVYVPQKRQALARAKRLALGVAMVALALSGWYLLRSGLSI